MICYWLEGEGFITTDLQEAKNHSGSVSEPFICLAEKKTNAARVKTNL